VMTAMSGRFTRWIWKLLHARTTHRGRRRPSRLLTHPTAPGVAA
jgi:hypothetical protein